jgi:hypothetical protein
VRPKTRMRLDMRVQTRGAPSEARQLCQVSRGQIAVGATREEVGREDRGWKERWAHVKGVGVGPVVRVGGILLSSRALHENTADDPLILCKHVCGHVHIYETSIIIFEV